jgi:hypothetical protein
MSASPMSFVYQSNIFCLFSIFNSYFTALNEYEIQQ